MPFVALRESNEDAPDEEEMVIPAVASTDDDLCCVQCRAEMSIRESHIREEDIFVARHFVHTESGECTGSSGESERHARMVSIAASKLEYEYPDAVVSVEEPAGNRVADVLVEFDAPRHPEGRGIAVEVQYRNKSKDIPATERDYFDMGYSVLWLYECDYRGRDVDLRGVKPVWPNGVRHEDIETHQRFTESFDATRTVPASFPGSGEVFEKLFRRAWVAANYEQVEPETVSDGTDDWVTLEKIQLSRRRWLQLVQSPDDRFFVQLSEKGDGGIRNISVDVERSTDELVRYFSTVASELANGWRHHPDLSVRLSRGTRVEFGGSRPDYQLRFVDRHDQIEAGISAERADDIFDFALKSKAYAEGGELMNSLSGFVMRHMEDEY